MRPSAIKALWAHMTPEEQAFAKAFIARDMQARRWRALPGPQSDAYRSEADIIGYGGAAGGGKTDLACGKAITDHRKVAIFRRVGTELTAIEDRLEELFGGREGYNSQKGVWRQRRDDGKSLQIELASTPNPGDEKKYQGRPHDLIVFDEAANFLELQVRFLMGWMRTTIPGQRCQALLAFNPPTTAEGRWIIAYFAPWLDDMHPNPAKPGELRWFATVKGKDLEVPDNTPFVLIDGKRVTEFKPADYAETDIIIPLSRTFIAAKVSDNPYLMGTGYMTTLQGLPEPLRSQMLKGDFRAGIEDDAWQVIPTVWIDAAIARWKPRDVKGVMDSIGADVSRGGQDETVISRRHGTWFDEFLAHAGALTPDGPAAAGHVLVARRDGAPVHIDIVGWGSSAFDFLSTNNIQTIGINGATGTTEEVTKEGGLKFKNMRALLYWRMREALDPTNPDPIALPPDMMMRAELAAPKWKLTPGGILIEPKEDIAKRLGRSPDRADAAVMALISTVKTSVLAALAAQARQTTYDPFANNGL